MRFCQQLQVWMEQTDCRASELCARAGIAAPSLSRYRSGERTPGRDSAAMDGAAHWRHWRRRRASPV